MTHALGRADVVAALEFAAHTASDLSRCQPAMDRHERDRINSEFQVVSNDSSISSNISRLPDEMMGILLQVSGGHVYSISNLINLGGCMPSVMALSRTAAETSVKAYWLSSSENSTERVGRVLWMNYERIKSMSERGADDQTIGDWKGELKKVLRRAGLNESQPKTDDLTRAMFQTEEQWETYKYLHNYVHGDPNVSMSDFIEYTRNPEQMRDRDIVGALFSGQTLITATKSVAQHRVIPGTLREQMEASHGMISVISDNFFIND